LALGTLRAKDLCSPAKKGFFSSNIKSYTSSYLQDEEKIEQVEVQEEEEEEDEE
jgi:hypothetical protein